MEEALEEDPLRSEEDFTATENKVQVGPIIMENVDEVLICIIPKCGMTSESSDPDVHLFKLFNPEESRITAWTQKWMNLLCYILGNHSWFPAKTDGICSLHFLRRFIGTDVNNKPWIKNLMAKPTLRLPLLKPIIVSDSSFVNQVKESCSNIAVKTKPVHSRAKCVIPSCNFGPGVDATLHRFPKKKISGRLKWIEVMQRLLKDDSWNPKEYDYMCSQHFEEWDRWKKVNDISSRCTHYLYSTSIPRVNLGEGILYEELMGYKRPLEYKTVKITPDPPATNILLQESTIQMETDEPPIPAASEFTNLANSNSISAKNICKIFTDLCEKNFPQDFKQDKPVTFKDVDIAKRMFSLIQQELQAENVQEEWHNIDTFIDESYPDANQHFEVNTMHHHNQDLDFPTIEETVSSPESSPPPLMHVPTQKPSNFVSQILQAIIHNTSENKKGKKRRIKQKTASTKQSKKITTKTSNKMNDEVYQTVLRNLQVSVNKVLTSNKEDEILPDIQNCEIQEELVNDDFHNANPVILACKSPTSIIL